jgi:hypothetical protein
MPKLCTGLSMIVSFPAFFGDGVINGFGLFESLAREKFAIPRRFLARYPAQAATPQREKPRRSRDGV